MGRSGQFCAWNDHLITELLEDPRYEVRPDGTVWRWSGKAWRETGRAKTNKNGKLYFHLKYKRQNLLVHRIVFRRFVGRLANDLVINHRDGNGLNNDPTNLELCTQSTNAIHREETREETSS